MTKLEAVKKNYGEDVEFLDEGWGVERFEDNGAIYSIRDDEELERDARENIEEIFNDCYDEKGLKEWVDQNGGIENFYDEEWVNDFRIEDPDTFADMSDEEILDYCKDCDYFCDGYPSEALDMQKMVDYVWDIDGAQSLSGYDGELHYCEGYTVIREE